MNSNSQHLGIHAAVNIYWRGLGGYIIHRNTTYSVGNVFYVSFTAALDDSDV